MVWCVIPTDSEKLDDGQYWQHKLVRLKIEFEAMFFQNTPENEVLCYMRYMIGTVKSKRNFPTSEQLGVDELPNLEKVSIPYGLLSRNKGPILVNMSFAPESIRQATLYSRTLTLDIMATNPFYHYSLLGSW